MNEQLSQIQQQIEELLEKNNELEKSLKKETEDRKKMEVKILQLENSLLKHRHLGYDKSSKLT